MESGINNPAVEQAIEYIRNTRGLEITLQHHTKGQMNLYVKQMRGFSMYHLQSLFDKIQSLGLSVDLSSQGDSYIFSFQA